MNGSPAGALTTIRRTLWAPAAVLGVHFTLTGLLIYERLPDVDIAMHLAGGLAVAHLTAQALDIGRESGAVGLRPAFLEPLLIVACTAVVAILWELHELALDTLIRTQQLGDAVDTLSDLSFGLLGAAAYAALRWRHGPGPRRG